MLLLHYYINVSCNIQRKLKQRWRFLNNKEISEDGNVRSICHGVSYMAHNGE